MPGKKIWLWALSREGAIWEELLTDDDGQYSEPQVGRLLNQNDHEFFAPYNADLWRDIWFPYKEIGPMVKATPYGALNVTKSDESITLGLCPLQEIDDELVVTVDDKEVYREHLALTAMEIYRKELPLKSGQGTVGVNVGRKIRYSDERGANLLKRPISFHSFDENTTEGLYLAAERYEKRRNYTLALEKYLGCLQREPLHTRALTRVAELYCRRGEYERALGFAHKALENVMYDPHANYIYGVISRHLGNMVDAKETLGWAARSMNYRSSAYCQMAEIYLLERDYDLAREYGRRALDFNKYNINAYQVLAITYRKLKQPRQARRVLEKLVEIDPLNHLARFELYQLETTAEKLNNFRSMIRNELPHENYLEMGVYYARLGLDSEAVQLLKYGPEYPTIYYWLGYLLRDEVPTDSEMYVRMARGVSAKLVFPFREESIPVFEWAIKTFAADWKAKYYLGLIYWAKGRVQEARELFGDCGEPDFAPFYTARAYLHKESDSGRFLADLEKALKVDDKDWRNWHHLVRSYNKQGMFDKGLRSAQKAVEVFPGEVPIRVDLVRSLMGNNRYGEALAVLEKTEVIPYEGAHDVHGLYVGCQIHLALEDMEKGNYRQAIRYIENSRLYPEHLGTGRPFEPDFTLQDRLKTICEDKMESKSDSGLELPADVVELIEAMDNKNK
jgi:tetratricopeptide (TPR) repeat protein